MADQPASPAKKDRPTGKLSLPDKAPGMNKLAPNNRAIEGKGVKVGPDIPVKEAPSKSDERDEEILERIRSRMERCIAAESENRKAAVDDRKFKAGEQWPADVLADRNTQKRPALTINRMKTFVHQVTNPARENRPQINLSPLGERADKDGAKMFEGLIRSIERDSHADVAYDTALDDAVTSGWGYMRLLTEWKSETSFDQVLVIKRVRNPFTVYLDPDRLEPDGSDSRYGFVTEIVPEDEFKTQFPKAQLIPFNLGGIGERYKDWVTKDGVRVAEYFEVVEEPADLVELSTGWIGFRDDVDELTERRIKNGAVEIKEQRKSARRSVKYYKVTAIEVLERNDWIGKWVPIVQVIGDEIDIEGKVKLSGIIRDAKDSQRQYNYWSPLALDTPIPTPNGWTTMGAIAAGDAVFSEHGVAVRVEGKSPIHLHRDCYRVTFDDGESIVADAGHPWSVETRGPRKSGAFLWFDETVTTQELTPGKHFIHTPKPLDAPAADLPIDPYLLGLWLGDGTSAEPCITPGDDDIDEIRDLLTARGLALGPKRAFEGRHGSFTVLGQRHKFSALGLLGNKHVPGAYLRASFDQRVDLLSGLMDTDGSISRSGQCSFTTTRAEIADAYGELLRTLGIKAVSIRRQGRLTKFPQGHVAMCADSWQFSFTPPSEFPIFKRSRQRSHQLRERATHWRRTKRFRIKSVERVASVPVQCIAVDSPSHLFLAGPGMVPTHNTSETELVALAPKAPYIMEEGQLEGHEQEWKTANTRPRAVLTYKATSLDGHSAPPPQRAGQVQIPEGVVSAKQAAAQDMMATTGIRFDSTLQERMHNESGKALRELNRKTDVGAFHYYDNFRRSLEFLGKQLVDAIPKLYTRRQVVTILREDMRSQSGGPTEQTVTLDPMMAGAYRETKTGDGMTRYFNPSFGEYGVTVDIGPSYATKRQEAAESMMDFVKAMPQTAQLVMDLIASEMDWPGAEKIANRLAKAIPAQLLTADMKDIPPQIQALIQNLEQQSKQMQAQLQAAMQALQDKSEDRSIAREKIGSDLEAKILGMLVKSEDAAKKLAMEQARMVSEHLIEEMRAERARGHERGMAQEARAADAETPEPDAAPDGGEGGGGEAA